MTTRIEYRQGVQSKLLALEDGGYGDFDYEDSDLDFFVAMSISQLYPAVYRRVKQAGLALTSYGTQALVACTPLYADRVFLIEDSAERQDVLGWRVSGTDIVDIDVSQGAGSSNVATVDVYYHDAYFCDSLPGESHDQQDPGIPPMFDPLVILGALIEACESRQDTGVRGDPPPIGQFPELGLIDRLNTRYNKLLEKMAMGLPAVRL